MGSSTSTTPTITVAQKYDDVLPYSGSFTSTRMITDCNVVLSWNEIPIKRESGVFSPNLSRFVTKCACLVVGGGGGRRSAYYPWPYDDESYVNMSCAGGGGRAGGNYVEKTIPLLSGDKISIQIGAGGNRDSQGGVSSIAISNQTITVSGRVSGRNVGSIVSNGNVQGADGGKGNGNGGKGGGFSLFNSVYDGENGTLGQQKNFYGIIVKTGGGGGGSGAYAKVESGFSSSKNGISADSDAGQRGIGGTAGLPGGCWIVYLHS